MQRDPRRAPTHPGEYLKEVVFSELGVNQAEFARHLGVSRQSLARLLNAQQGVTPEMALRLAGVVGSTPRFWLALQQQHDLWYAEKNFNKAELKPIAAISAAE